MTASRERTNQQIFQAIRPFGLKFVLDVIAIVIASFIIYGICMSILSLIDRGLIEGNLVSEVIDRIFTLLVYIAGIFSAKYIRRG